MQTAVTSGRRFEGIGSVWREVFHESSINDALRAKGDKVVLAPAAVVSQHRLG